MSWPARQRQLDALLLNFHELWHPQPFREQRPAWCERWPALTAELLTLSEAGLQHLGDDDAAAVALLARHIPEVAELLPLANLPARPMAALADYVDASIMLSSPRCSSGSSWRRAFAGRGCRPELDIISALS